MLLEMQGLCEILRLSRLSAGGTNNRFRCSFSNRRRRLSPLYSCIAWLEYITDQPGPRGRAFRLGRPFAVEADRTAVSPRRLGKRGEASLEGFAGLRSAHAALNWPFPV